LGAGDEKVIDLEWVSFGTVPGVEFTVTVKEGTWSWQIKSPHQIEDSFTASISVWVSMGAK
jgi:hypothetical protein